LGGGGGGGHLFRNAHEEEEEKRRLLEAVARDRASPGRWSKGRTATRPPPILRERASRRHPPCFSPDKPARDPRNAATAEDLEEDARPGKGGRGL